MSGAEACRETHLHTHVYPSDGRMEQALKLLRSLTRKVDAMSGSFGDIMSAITGLEGRVQGMSDVTQGAIDTLTELAMLVRDVRTQLDAAGSEDERRAAAARLGEIGDALDARKGALAAAIASTDPTPAPQPEPAPVEPTPDPAPAPTPPDDAPPAPTA